MGELTLSNTQIEDLTPLSELTKLKELRLERNQINDLTPLSGLNQLEWLDLTENETEIEDLTPLAKLTQLKCLISLGRDRRPDPVERLNTAGGADLESKNRSMTSAPFRD